MPFTGTASETASMPLLQLGKSVRRSGLHVAPPSCDQHSNNLNEVVRPSICRNVGECTRMLGCVALGMSPCAIHGDASNVAPPSRLRSTYTCQPASATSALQGEST